jgi:aminoglycoside phosphotransferase family enzyme/predicted kinase
MFWRIVCPSSDSAHAIAYSLLYSQGFHCLMTELPEQLLRPDAYPHPVAHIELVETLLSWVFLTGVYAYKVKKPVHFDYVDFSTLALRKHFCEEELRCNTTYAPELYRDVVAIARSVDGKLTVCASDRAAGATIIDYAVKMLQFDPAAQADRRLDAGLLGVEELRQFGRTLATQHALLAAIDAPVDPVAPMLDNFTTLRTAASASHLRVSLAQLELATREEAEQAKPLLSMRHREGFVRECHGDLHLQNMVLTERGIRAFDCLEFDRTLRVIDVWCDAAFLVMDCCVRGREDLGYAFIDGYLDQSGDYAGVALLPLYARYRAMVRAKVAALQLEQSFASRKLDMLNALVAWATRQRCRGPGRLVVTCGVSGSGKSFWAAQLAPALPAIRLRSDVLRKYRHGLPPNSESGSALEGGIYGKQSTRDVYEQLATLARELLQRGENVIVDCTNLHVWQRELFYAAAEAARSRCVLLHFSASKAVLQQRIAQRRAQADDASEADEDVLEWQLANEEPPAASEPVVRVDSERTSLRQIMDAVVVP